MLKSQPALTIGAVSERTGVSPALLRAWESRFGFPRPSRSAAGHRRYCSEQVDQIMSVLRLRHEGLSLAASLAAAQAPTDPAATSIYAEVRRRWPAQPVTVLSKRAMHALSRAIEDECRAQADRPVLIGCFQHERFYRQSERRWRELARTAESAIVFADFDPGARPSDPRVVAGPEPIEVALADDAPLLREWAVVCDGPRSTACVIGVERSESPGRRRRQYEAIWSVDPDLVHDAAKVGRRLVPHPVDRPAPAVGTPDGPAPDDPADLVQRATAIANRALAYLDT